MQTLYACACDIKSNVGLFPLIIIIILILSSLLLRVVVLVVVVLGTTKKKKKSSSGLSQKKNEKERFLDMKKTRFDVRGHTRKKKKDRGRGVFTFTFFEEIFYFFPLGKRKRDAKRREKTWGARVSPKKGANNPQK